MWPPGVKIEVSRCLWQYTSPGFFLPSTNCNTCSFLHIFCFSPISMLVYCSNNWLQLKSILRHLATPQSLIFSPQVCGCATFLSLARLLLPCSCNILLNYNITPFLSSPGIIFLSSWFQKRGQNRETSSPHHLPQTSFPLWKSTSGVFVQFLSTCSLLHSISNIIKVWDWVRCNTRYWFISFHCLSSLIIIAVFISLKICLTLPLL